MSSAKRRDREEGRRRDASRLDLAKGLGGDPGRVRDVDDAAIAPRLPQQAPEPHAALAVRRGQGDAHHARHSNTGIVWPVIELKTPGEIDAVAAAGRVVADHPGRHCETRPHPGSARTSWTDRPRHDRRRRAPCPASSATTRRWAPTPYPAVICSASTTPSCTASRTRTPLQPGDLLQRRLRRTPGRLVRGRGVQRRRRRRTRSARPRADRRHRARAARGHRRRASRGPARRHRARRSAGVARPRRLRDARRPRRPRRRPDDARGAARAERGPGRARA